MNNLLSKQNRIEKLQEIVNAKYLENVGSLNLKYRGTIQNFKAYRVPLNCIVYNPLNGRIASRVKSYEKENHILDNENPEDINIIEKFLWESKKDRNQSTEEDLIRNGQLVPGVIDKAGKIIDGNRRASLLRKIINEKTTHQGMDLSRCEYFLAVILEDELDEKQMLELEMQIQEADSVLDYNAIEKYLKCSQLHEAGFDNEEIKIFMRLKNESEVENNLKIKKLMDEYLENLGYSGIYTQLDGKEDMFIGLNNTLKKFENGRLNPNMDWDPDEFDIAELKALSFDIIRYGTDNNEEKKYRLVTGASQDAFIYSNKAWKTFKEVCLNKLDELEKQEKTLDEIREKNNNSDTDSLIKSRDDEWRKKVSDTIKEGIGKSSNIVEAKKEANQPLKLLEKVEDIIETINTQNMSFYDEITHTKLKNINHQIYELIKINEKGIKND